MGKQYSEQEIDPTRTRIVQTVFGKVSGDFYVENGITIYKGVPYAKPPVGDLRWAAPADPEPWDGVRACDTYAPMAVQILSTTDWWGPEFYYEYKDKKPVMSEDCIYLNVATPAQTPDENCPVLVWFHGGASMHGYSYEPEFNPEELCKKGIIVVSVGYRLGVFGYLATKDLSAASPTGTSGNYGLLDQIKSLEWVRKNIKMFGGDPTRVTIAGQSAGAGAVCSILTSPLATDLFDRAIMDSSFSALSRRSTLDQTETACDTYLKDKGYAGLSVTELRALPTSAFVNENTPKSEVYGKGFTSMVDGYAMTHSPIDFFKQKGALKGKNILFGVNCGEGNGEFSIITKSIFMESSKKTYQELFDKYNFSELYNTTDDFAATMESLRLRSETGGTQNLIVALMLNQLNPVSSLYPYYFSHWAPGREAEIRWAWHSSELWYVFKSLRDIPQQRDWTELDFKIAENCSSYWANFVATGNPNGGDLSYWPATSLDNPVFMEWGDTFRLRSNFYGNTKKSVRDDLMREYIISSNGLQKFFR
ncbi:MAG: carboxylesterase family protein [Candidatus Bathyarchaeia archaeon]